MVCRFCGEMLVRGVLLPEPENPNLGLKEIDLSDPKNSAFGCYDCAVKNGYFCLTHGRIHNGFGKRGGHACLDCIETTAEEMEDEVADLLAWFPDAIPAEDFEELIEDLGIAGGLVTAVRGETPETTGARCLARHIACVAVAKLTTPQEIIAQIRETRDITIVLPHPLGFID
jgi:hypothetical protein